MAYGKYPTKYEKPKSVTAEYLILKWQTIGVLGSRLAMAVEGNAPQEVIDKLKYSEENFKESRESWEQYDRI